MNCLIEIRLVSMKRHILKIVGTLFAGMESFRMTDPMIAYAWKGDLKEIGVQ